MYPDLTRRAALDALNRGVTISELSLRTGIHRSTLREWRDRPRPQPGACPTCDGAEPPTRGYSALLGYYLGDGCISAAARYFALRIVCDAAYPGIIGDVTSCIRSIRPGARVHQVAAPGCVHVQNNWKHWPCLFPQHGPGRKHERPIVLEPWQCEIVAEHPGPFLRGLFHSDGARVANWATRTVAGRTKRYDYTRWQFTNHSEDILGLCCWALDLAEIPWRRSSWKRVSVSRRDAVARLDDIVGPKR